MPHIDKAVSEDDRRHKERNGGASVNGTHDRIRFFASEPFGKTADDKRGKFADECAKYNMQNDDNDRAP